MAARSRRRHVVAGVVVGRVIATGDPTYRARDVFWDKQRGLGFSFDRCCLEPVAGSLRPSFSDEEEVLQIPELIGEALRNAEAVGDRTEPNDATRNMHHRPPETGGQARQLLPWFCSI